jgi:hypothetical protein
MRRKSGEFTGHKGMFLGEYPPIPTHSLRRKADAPRSSTTGLRACFAGLTSTSTAFNQALGGCAIWPVRPRFGEECKRTPLRPRNQGDDGARIPRTKPQGPFGSCLSVTARIVLWRCLRRAFLYSRGTSAFTDRPESATSTTVDFHRRHDDGNLHCCHAGGA